MSIKIYPITLGASKSYIIHHKGTIMVDCGSPKKANEFTKVMLKIPISPEDIQLIVITHGHWDHIGSAREIKELTGAKIAMHRLEKDWLENSLKVMPPGVTARGHVMNKLMTMFLPLIKITGTHVDIAIEDEGLSLDEYGIPGKVVYTPGHSPGSVSILLETGDAFVGDMAMNKFPLRFSPGLPIFAEDLQTVKESWQLLLNLGALKICPGHGKPFPADNIRKALS